MGEYKAIIKIPLLHRQDSMGCNKAFLLFFVVMPDLARHFFTFFILSMAVLSGSDSKIRDLLTLEGQEGTGVVVVVVVVGLLLLNSWTVTTSFQHTTTCCLTTLVQITY